MIGHMTNERAVPRWLEWAREIQALSQTGLTYSETDYNTQRYRRLLEIAAEIVESAATLPRESVLESFRMQAGYATPKVDVRAAVTREGKILLVQEKSDGRWCMPGGWADVGETPSAAAAREAREESGFTVVPRAVVGIYDANRQATPLEFYHAYKIVFRCELTGGEARPSAETQGVDFFGLDGLPPLSTQRTNERHLADVRAHLKVTHPPTVFD
jgi:ADP-ribose pyrophosphatase YjhB (NUDIX family)